MSHPRMLLCGLLLLWCLTIPAMAQPGRQPVSPHQQPPTAKQQHPDMLAVMTKEVGLTRDQQAKMKAKISAMEVALKNWDAKNKAKMEKLKAEMQAAVKAKNKEKMQQVQKNFMPLIKTRNEIGAKYAREIIAVLTPAQKAKWEVYLLYQPLSSRYMRLKLTQVQQDKIKNMCKTALAQKKPADNDANARVQLFHQLCADVEKKVLTDAQRKQLKADEEKMKALMEQSRKNQPPPGGQPDPHARH